MDEKTEDMADGDANLQFAGPRPGSTIEERCFSACLICLEGHFSALPPMGPLTTAKISSMTTKTLEKTHTLKDVRETLSQNVAVWIWLTRIFAAAIPSLTTRSVGPLPVDGHEHCTTSAMTSRALIIKNHASIKEDLTTLTKLMHIARNLLVTSEPRVPQDISAAVHFDQMVYQTIVLCVNVTSKGYDPDGLGDGCKSKLDEITEAYKKLLTTALQQMHNWTAKHDRNKMSLWNDALLDEDAINAPDTPRTSVADAKGNNPFLPKEAKVQVTNWLELNSRLCDKARALLRDYQANCSHQPPGSLPSIRPLAWNWMPDSQLAKVLEEHHARSHAKTPMASVWKPNEPAFMRDKAYGRVSREIDLWWERARDANYDKWITSTCPVEDARQRAVQSIKNVYRRMLRPDESPGDLVDENDAGQQSAPPEQLSAALANVTIEQQQQAEQSSAGADDAHEGASSTSWMADDCYQDYDDDLDDGDDGEYSEGSFVGLLTEIPSILAPKQIEALHMIVKSCILDSPGAGRTRADEDLQSTRCKMFLALESGRSLLREMLVFIAVWEHEDKSLIFQLTAQIVETLHANALIPYAWNSLRISKDIMSPAQTVLLRLLNYIFAVRAKNSASAVDERARERDLKLVHFFFQNFRTKVVPESVALMHLQYRMRGREISSAEFHLDIWDMDRARDGVSQFLHFLITCAESGDIRSKLIEWNLAYDLVTMLEGLEIGVPGKSKMDEQRVQTKGHPAPPPPASISETAESFAWVGIKSQILTVMGCLLQPPPGKASPGNPAVQQQILTFGGLFPLLGCATIDSREPYARERAILCIKMLLDSSEATKEMVRKIMNSTKTSWPQPHSIPQQDSVNALATGLFKSFDDEWETFLKETRVDLQKLMMQGLAAFLGEPEFSGEASARTGSSLEDNFM